MQNTEVKYEVRPIAGYEGLYSVSTEGEVFSHNYCNTGRTRELRQSKNSKGYLQVHLQKDGEYKRHKVHRLVLQTFKPNPDNKPCCDHIDTDKTNNHISNLRWVTHKENSNNPLTRENQRDKAIYIFKNKNTGKIFVGERYMFIEKSGLSPNFVSMLIKGKAKSAKGWVLVQIIPQT